MPSSGSLSHSPRMCQTFSPSLVSATTVTPGITSSVVASAKSDGFTASRSACISVCFCISWRCSSFAYWYSAFSERSPKPLANSILRTFSGMSSLMSFRYSAFFSAKLR